MTDEVMITSTYEVHIYIAGELAQIKSTCRHFCLRGLCVSVTPTTYVFTGGQEDGAIIGLINYPRFPREPEAIRADAYALAKELMDACCQRSCTVQAPEESEYLTNNAISIPR